MGEQLTITLAMEVDDLIRGLPNPFVWSHTSHAERLAAGELTRAGLIAGAASQGGGPACGSRRRIAVARGLHGDAIGASMAPTTHPQTPTEIERL